MSPVIGSVSPARATTALVLGAVMVALGLLIASRPLWVRPEPQPLTTSFWLDYGFAAFFLLRGGMNVRAALAARNRARALPSDDDAR